MAHVRPYENCPAAHRCGGKTKPAPVEVGICSPKIKSGIKIMLGKQAGLAVGCLNFWLYAK